MATKSPPPKPEPLHGVWRGILFVLAVGLMVTAVWAWVDPPMKKEFAPQAATAGATSDVQVRSETTTVLLFGLAVLLIVIAANGRKLTSVKIGVGEVSTEVAEAAGTAGGKAEAQGVAEGLPAAKAKKAGQRARATVYAEAQTRDLDDLDIDVIADSAVQVTKTS